jgi:hypothetical protein
MALLAGSVGAVSSPLVLSCGGVGTTDVQEPGVEEPSEGGAAWRNPPILGEVSSNQVQDES